MARAGTIRERFPGPWRVEETQGGHFQIVSGNGASIAYVYVGNPVLKWDALTVAEARAIALAIAALGNS
jgi:hypothetical protein